MNNVIEGFFLFKPNLVFIKQVVTVAQNVLIYFWHFLKEPTSKITFLFMSLFQTIKSPNSCTVVMLLL